MSLASGTRLGPYEIQSAIGAGGMGEVYRALDTRLGRTVAIKVLPADAASDPDPRPFESLRVAPSTAEGRQTQGRPERSRGPAAAPGSSARPRL